MIDFTLTASAIESLLSSMNGARDVERYKAYAAIIALSRELEKFYKRRGVTDFNVDEKIAEMRYYAAHSAGLITDGNSQELHIRWSRGALRSVISSLELTGFKQHMTLPDL